MRDCVGRTPVARMKVAAVVAYAARVFRATKATAAARAAMAPEVETAAYPHPGAHH